MKTAPFKMFDSLLWRFYGGGRGAMPFFSKVSIKNSMFSSKAVQSFFDFGRVALFILLNAIFIACI